MTSGLTALSSACVLTVYAAGYLKTKPAADRLAEADARRRPDAEFAGRGGVERRAADTPAGAPAGVSFTLPTRSASPRPDRAASGTQATEAGPTAPVERAAVPPPDPPVTQAPAAHREVAARVVEPAATSPALPVEAPVAAPAAPATIQPPAPDSVTPSLYKDGTYLGWGNCRHGDIQASVTVAGGRIVSAAIAQCWTRYSCNWLDPVVPQVVQRQSPNVDYVSGATQSTDAFYWAVIDALSKAK